MTNKALGTALLWTMGALMVTAIMEESFGPATADGLYTIIGFAMFVFGIWGGIRLRNCEQVEKK